MNDFLDRARSGRRSSDVLAEGAFRHWQASETSRPIRYQHFFSICLIKPDLFAEEDTAVADLQRDVATKVAELLRSTDVVGRVHDGTAVLLLHTASAEAGRVAERLRARIGNVTFAPRPTHRPRRITLSVGEVSFPRDGSNGAVLLARAAKHLLEATRRGGNQIVRSEDLTA